MKIDCAKLYKGTHLNSIWKSPRFENFPWKNTMNGMFIPASR
jgi:hypothetical protein